MTLFIRILIDLSLAAQFCGLVAAMRRAPADPWWLIVLLGTLLFFARAEYWAERPGLGLLFTALYLLVIWLSIIHNDKSLKRLWGKLQSSCLTIVSAASFQRQVRQSA